MYKFLPLMLILLLTACNQEEKVQQVIIPDAQLQALQKAKNMQSEFVKAQQKRDLQYKEQGL